MALSLETNKGGKPTVESSWFDRAVSAVSPSWGLNRYQNKLKIASYSDNGFIVPGGGRKSMKGITATPNSPDSDIIGKLDGIRGLQRDLFMNSPLAASILRRHKIDVVNSGLQLQASVDNDVLGISEEQAQEVERLAEKEFDIWAESTFCDYDEQLFFGEMLGVTFINMLMSGDCYFVLPFEKPVDKDHPYGTRIKLIDADLVRDPVNVNDKDIKGGVEKDSKGRIAAIHVWNTYSGETWNYTTDTVSESKRIPIYSESGKRQVFQVADFERIGQRRGVSLLAPAVEPLKQITRLSEAQLMNAIVSAFFSVFVKDTSGMGSIMAPNMTPAETLFGGGRYTPDGEQVEEVDLDNGNDLEMGSGNINYLDDQTDITIADPKKVDTGFADFWEALANQVCAAGGMPLEKAMLKYTTSYTAARAALIDAWKGTSNYRTLLARRMCKVAYEAVFEEAVLSGRIDAPKYFDDVKYKKAWTGSRWVGIGMGSLDPLKESKATLFNLRTDTTTKEDDYQERKGGRWDVAMKRRAREERFLEQEGLAGGEEVAIDETVSTKDEG